MNPTLSIPVPTPFPGLLIPTRAQISATEPTPQAALTGDLVAARKAHRAKRAGWAALNLRQDFADAPFMRAHLSTAGVRIPDSLEPATAARLKTHLGRAGVKLPEAVQAIGTTLAGFLALNAELPLWAALALVLEATGRFTPQGAS